MKETPDINYLNKEFSDIRQELINFAENYFPDTYKDFSPSSPGMMFIEMAAYVGDILSFYTDTQIQETFLQHAKNPANLYSLAYAYGYRPKLTRSSEVELTVSQTVDAVGDPKKPDWSQAEILSGDQQIVASNGQQTPFNLFNSVDFSFSSSFDPTEVEPIVGVNEEIEEFRLIKKVKAFSGEIVSQDITIEGVEKFRTEEIGGEGIIRVLSIKDDQDNEWKEVPYLGQETLPIEDTVKTEGIRKSLQVTKVPKRFITRFTSNQSLQIQFGAGIKSSSDQENFLPNPENVNEDNEFFKTYDPTNFVFTDSYGLAPTNSDSPLTVEYLVGQGRLDNISAGDINLSETVNGRSITITNEEPSQGGRGPESVEELRQNISRAFNQQNRVVTLEDYVVRAVGMPSEFGTVEKAFPIQTRTNVNTSSTNTSIDLYVLSKDIENKLAPANNILKENLKQYLSEFIPITQTVNILNAFIINIGVEVEILPRPGSNPNQVLGRTIQAVSEFFDTKNRSINSTIDLNNLYTVLDKVQGVQTVENINIINKAGNIDGRQYSQNSYDITSARRNNIIFPSLDPSIFEVKSPEEDIKVKLLSI